MSIGFIICLALGVWAGNWASAFIVPGRSLKDGFWIGLIAAVLTIICGLIHISVTQ